MTAEIDKVIEALGQLALRRSQVLQDEARVWVAVSDVLKKARIQDLFPQREPERFGSKDKFGGARLLPAASAAEYLGISKRTLESWRVRGGGPEFEKMGRRVLYRVTALEAFAKSHTYPHTSAYKND